ncbi:MAG: hypothetical protein H0X66_10875 [Verrucomicrobia bacterium]|nr:hypothetical protein [Verrucomicrobiota bacterium]
MNPTRFATTLLAACAALILTGCQTYNQQNTGLAHWRNGNVELAAKEYSKKTEKEKTTKDSVIWRLEEGTVLRAAARYEESNAAFTAAEEQIDAFEEKAKISVSRETGAMFSNQATLPYEGRAFDKIMLHTYKALNYLQLGESDKARVEIIRAYQRQQDAVEENKRRIEKAEKAAAKQAEESESTETPSKGKAKEEAQQQADAQKSAEQAKSDERFLKQVDTAYGDLDAIKAYADYVNPLAVYLDGIFFMSNAADNSDLERARKSLERTLALTGENKFIQEDIEALEKVTAGQPISPTTYVIFETGLAPVRDQIRIDLPIILAGSLKVPYVGAAFPKLLYNSSNFLHNVTISTAERSEHTLSLASVDSIVANDFKNELPTIITKTLLSTTIKAIAAYAANKAVEKEDAFTRIAVALATATAQAAVNIADTRTWTTLPKEFQFCRIATPEDRKLEIIHPVSGEKVSVELQEGTVNLLFVKAISANTPLLVSQAKLK